ncbi:MAG: phosphoadenylyl-sulfate reductase [Candidatus Omnitrophica bacterium]|nr:phosphoadenylyl-sulfate reductase [Candidatus Omnitrophota bacterium]
MPTAQAWNENSVSEVAKRLESKDAEGVLRWGVETFFPRIGFASSFGAEDVVVIDILMKINREVTIFTLDTGRLPEETYEVMDQIRQRYTVPITSYFPDKAAVEKLEREKGFYSFRQSVENRKECCGIRKVEPLNRALQGLEAWITGLRREQAVTRSGLPKAELDSAHRNIVKLNPISDWTTDQVWDYLRKNQIPYNKLHDRNYPSIGCAPCTRAIKPGEDIRAGRWWWELPEQKECGLHVKPGH